MIQAVHYANANGTRVDVIDLTGLVWNAGIDDDNHIAASARAWVAQGRPVQPFQTPPITAENVNAERDRRLASFPFGGNMFDFCDDRGSDINIAGAGTLALAAIITGAQAGDLRWANAGSDFSWVAADNSSVMMDAQTCLNFAKAAADWKAKHIRKARELKDMSPIPADYASDSRWTS